MGRSQLCPHICYLSLMRLVISLVAILLTIGAVSGQAIERPVILGLRPAPPQEVGEYHGNQGILFFGSGEWLAYVRVKGELESVVTRFPDGRVEESETWDSVRDLAISPDGRTLTYVGRRGEKSHFVVNGVPGPGYAGISANFRTVFSTDGRHWAYVANRDDSHYVVVRDGVEEPFNVSFSARPVFNPKSGKLVYMAEQGVLVVDGKPVQDASESWSHIQFKADTGEAVYLDSRGASEDRFVVVGGQEGKHYGNVYAPRVSADGATVAYVAERDRQSFVVINGREFGPYACCIRHDDLVMDPDGRRITYPAGVQSGKARAYRLIVDGVASAQSYGRIQDVVLSRPGSPRARIAFTAERGSWPETRSAVVVDEIPGDEYQSVSALLFTPGGDLFYVAEKDGKAFAVHEREQGASFDEISDFSLSDNGRWVAFNGRRNGKSYVVRWTGSSWKESAPYDSVARSILFDASGAPVYRATRKRQQFVVIGDQEQTPYDAVHDVRVGLDGRGVLAVASSGKKLLLVLDGREIAVEDGIGVLGTPEKYRRSDDHWKLRVTAGSVNGFLAGVDPVELFYLQLNDKTIYTYDGPRGGGPSVEFQGKVKDEDVLLLGEYHGDGCVLMHTLIAIDSGGDPFVSEPFGTCGGAKIGTFEDRIEFTFLKDDAVSPDERWVYRTAGALSHELFKRQDRRNLRTQEVDKGDAIARSWGPQADFFIKQNFEIMLWIEAEPLLLKGASIGGKQYHNGWLLFGLQDGRRFLTKPPDINFVLTHRLPGFGVE